MLLPRTPMTLPVRAPGRPSCPRSLSPDRTADPICRTRGDADLEVRRIKAGESGLELGLQPSVPLPLEGDVEQLGIGRSLGELLFEGGVGRVVQVRATVARPGLGAVPVRLRGELTFVSAMEANPG